MSLRPRSQRATLVAFGLSLVVVLVGPASSSAEPDVTPVTHVLVQVEGASTLSEGASVRPGWRRVPVRAGEGVAAAIVRLSVLPSVSLVIPDSHAVPHGFPSDPPNDPRLTDQWAIPAIRANAGWVVTGGSGTTVAILDSGIDQVTGLACRSLVHPFRARTLFESVPNVTTDPDGHGTAVATIAAACVNDAFGTAGVAYDIDLMPVVVCENFGGGVTCPASYIAAGIDWAVAHGADVINLSIGWPTPDVVAVVADAIDDAVASGVVVVASAGNQGDVPVGFPASYGPVIGVGSTTVAGLRANHSATGLSLDVVAPGEGILVETDPAWCGSAFCSATGTSFAASHVSGVTALLLAIGADRYTAEDALKAAAKDLGPPGFDTSFGHGQVDVLAAMARIAECPNDVPDLVGTTAADVLSGGAGASVIWGLAGKDSIGSDAAGHICGGSGDDWIRAPGGAEIHGGSGRDSCDLFLAGNVRTGCERGLLPTAYDVRSALCVGPYWCDTYGWVELDQGVWRFPTDLVGNPGVASSSSGFYFGDPADVPFMGDWDCDGFDSPGLYRQSDGLVYLRNARSQGIGDVSFYFGDPNDVPLAGDFDGDGCDTVSLYRPSEARFYVINELGSGGNGIGSAEYSFLFGDGGDVPFVGDWDGDGIDGVALHRPTTGRIYYRLTLTRGVADFDFVYGNPGDLMFAGDWDGDGDDSLAVYRPSEGLVFLKLRNSQGVADFTQRVVPMTLVGRPIAVVAAVGSNLVDP